MSFPYYPYARVTVTLEVKDSAGNKTRGMTLILQDGDGRKVLADAVAALIDLVGTTSIGYRADGSSYTERPATKPFSAP